LEVGDSQLPAPKPGYGTLGLRRSLLPACAYGAFTLFGGPFQATSASPVRRKPGPQPYISHESSPWDLVWTFPFSLAATRGIPFWFLFLPLLRCFRSGGSRSLLGAPQTPEGICSRRSHSGIPGSKAAYAYPGPFRGWPRPSSALKPNHPPDGVACRAFCGVCLTFAVNLCVLWPVHGFIMSFIGSFASSLPITLMGSCI
jgi:hypothetical protein